MKSTKQQIPSRYIVRGQKVQSSKLKRAKELRSEMTSTEKALWQNLRGNKLGGLHFRRQQIIGGFIVDFYCHEAGLVIEVDGPVHKGQQEYDGARTELFRQRGLSVIRFSNNEIEDGIDNVLSRIAKMCRIEV